jgi:hypothetical protein
MRCEAAGSSGFDRVGNEWIGDVEVGRLRLRLPTSPFRAQIGTQSLSSNLGTIDGELDVNSVTRSV